MGNLVIYGDASKNKFGEWLSSYGLYISFALAGAVFLTVLGLFIYAKVKAKKDGPVYHPQKEVKVIKNEAVLQALGGAENVVSHSLNGSRIILVLQDYTVVNEASLKELGVDSIVKMSNKITLVVKGDASSFYKSMF